MYKVKRIGCYNIDIEGDIWNNDNLYGIVRFSKFNDDEEEVEHKTIYFQILNDDASFLYRSMPKFKTEKQISDFLKDKKNGQVVRKYAVWC